MRIAGRGCGWRGERRLGLGTGRCVLVRLVYEEDMGEEGWEGV